MSSSVWLTDELSTAIKENDNFHENAELVVKDVFDDKVDITVLVERLSGVLTDINPEFRARGMCFFSKVLFFLPKNYLTEAQLKFISSFYVDRLKDNHRVIPPVLEGVVALSKMKNLPNDAPSQFLMSIYNNVPCQQQVRTDRHHIYSIINTFLQSHNRELKAMGPDLVYGVIAAMDGERDPRNLMLLFTILPTFLKSIPLGHLSEEMFEVIACYYPVDFNSPPDDPNAITRNDLADRLCVCLCATPAFAEFCLSLLLEKLDSKLRMAKLDSLKLLKQSCSVFPAESYDLHLQTIWAMLQLELANKTDSDMVQAAHDALLALINNLCSDLSQPNIGKSFLDKILITMKLLLADAKTKSTLELPLRVFLTIANASEKSCIFIMENAVPLLIVHYHLNMDETLQVSSLEWFARVFESCISWNLLSQTSHHFTQIPTMCINAMNSSNDDLKVSSLNTVAAVADIIQPTEITILCEILDRNIHSSSIESLADSSKKCLLELAKKDPKLYSDYVQDKLNFDQIIDNKSLLEKRLDMLCTLSSINIFSEFIVTKLLSIFTEHASKAHVLITVLLKNFDNKIMYTDNKICEMQMKYNLLNCILEWSDQNMNQNNAEVLDKISKLIIRIVKTLESNVQYQILELYVPIYTNQLSVNSKYIILIEALLNSTRQDVKLIQTDEVLSRAMDLALNEQESFVQHKSCLLIANIMNKHGKEEAFSDQYSKIKEKLSTISDEGYGSNVISLQSWITKSLLQSGHPDSSYWLGKITDKILTDAKWGLEAAKGIKLIMAECSEALNADCFCIVSLLYRQKVFQLFLHKTGNLKLAVNREAYLLAWAYIIQSVSKMVLQMESAKISSILIESLDFTEQELLLTTLATLSFLIQKKNPDIAGSLQSLIPRCVKLSSHKGSMKVRIGSLQCLFDIANFYPTVVLLPYKEDIITQLSPALDDPKRLVRRVAVKARTRWFLVGSPGEDKIKS